MFFFNANVISESLCAQLTDINKGGRRSSTPPHSTKTMPKYPDMSVAILRAAEFGLKFPPIHPPTFSHAGSSCQS